MEVIVFSTTTVPHSSPASGTMRFKALERCEPTVSSPRRETILDTGSVGKWTIDNTHGYFFLQNN
jgi:hypothetical protein